MNFPAHGEKATQAVARIILQSGGPIDYLRIVKLAYLADRASIVRRGVPIVGGQYYSMKQGPTIGEVMNFVNRRGTPPQWKETISPRFGNEVRLECVPEFGALSEAEIQILDAVVFEHGKRTTAELVTWCHENCPEYQHVLLGRKSIEVESILKSANKSEEQIKKIVDEANHVDEMDKLLA